MTRLTSINIESPGNIVRVKYSSINHNLDNNDQTHTCKQTFYELTNACPLHCDVTIIV